MKDFFVSIFKSKKMTTFIVTIVITVLAANGVVVPPEMIPLAVQAITVIGSAMIGFQAISDGMSKGKTSAGYKAEADLEEAFKLAQKIIKEAKNIERKK